MISDKIVFEWNGDHYTVPEAAFPVVLPNGEILTGDSWGETFPEKPLNLKKLFGIKVTVDVDLVLIAAGLQGVLAEQIQVNIVSYCPNGCDNPTEPYCSKCGAKVDSIAIASAAATTLPKHVIDGVVPVAGEGPCPNCMRPLSHNEHAAHCPNCGQALHWTCRSA